MKHYYAIINDPKEKGYHGQIVASTKTPHGQFNGMTKKQFAKRLKDMPVTCFRFDIVEN